MEAIDLGSCRWPQQFEAVLRAHVPSLAGDVPIEPHASLFDLGLDSLATVALLVGIEDAFGIMIPDEDLSPNTFATPMDLWAVVGRLR
jgi:acyl carrier protein